MKVPFLDLKKQYQSIKNEIDPAVQEIMNNASFILGESVAEFESEFAKAHGARYCYGVSSGTDGNHISLWALGLGAGDEVIIPANTFIATVWGATLCGATPVFVECHPESYNIDPAKLEKAITAKTKAIVAVHLYGQPADIDGIADLLKSKKFEMIETGVFVNENTGQKIFLVEDCAQAHLSEYKGSKVGVLGIASSFSFYPGKNLGAYGEAGAVMTNNETYAKSFKLLRDHGAEQKYIHQVYGHNYRMEGIQGAVLGVKLKHLNNWTAERRRVAAKYNDLLQNLDGIKLPVEMPYSKHVYHLFVVQVLSDDEKSDGNNRDIMQKYLSDNGVSTGLHYPVPLHLQPCFKNFGYNKGDFPVSENLAERALSLPMFPELTDQQIEYVCEHIIKFYKE